TRIGEADVEVTRRQHGVRQLLWRRLITVLFEDVVGPIGRGTLLPRKPERNQQKEQGGGDAHQALRTSLRHSASVESARMLAGKAWTGWWRESARPQLDPKYGIVGPSAYRSARQSCNTLIRQKSGIRAALSCGLKCRAAQRRPHLGTDLPHGHTRVGD